MPSAPKIFIDDFERSEFSDSIQAMIGRSLILATRFDSKCIELRRAVNIEEAIHFSEESALEKMPEFVEQLYKNDMNLFNTIKSFKLEGDNIKILTKARIARNGVAHKLCKDLLGCIETNMLVSSDFIIEEITRLSKDIIEGEALISLIMSNFLNEPVLRFEFLELDKKRLLEWVVEL